MSLLTGEDLLRATRTAVDKVESLFNESFLPEEIQLFLNKSQLRLMDDLVNKNFQQGILRYEWLRPWQTEAAAAVAWGVGQYTLMVSYPVDQYYFIAAQVQTQISTDVYNPQGVQKRCLNDIDGPDVTPENTFTQLQQLDIQETGETRDREQNNFYGENYRNPRAELVGDGLRLYRGIKFLINAVVFDYVTKPIDIDVSSPTTLLWSSSANEKIVDYTVEYMRLSIEDPAYQGNVQDFNIRTQNA